MGAADAGRARGHRPAPDFFRLLQAGDVLVHHPYDSFATSVEQFVEQAASDPHVLAIKQTIYRTAGAESALVRLADQGRRAGQAGGGARRAQGPLRRAGQHRTCPRARRSGRARRVRPRRARRPTPRCSSSCARRPTASGATATSAPATTTRRPRTPLRGPRAALRRPRPRRRPHRPLQPPHRLQPPGRSTASCSSRRRTCGRRSPSASSARRRRVAPGASR